MGREEQDMKRIIVFFTVAVLLALLVPGPVFANPISPGKDIVKYTFIHYQSSHKGGKSGNTNGAYSLYKGGVKWAEGVIVSYKVNSSNAPGGEKAIEASFKEWDDETSRNLFADSAAPTKKSGVSYDGENTISWTSIPQQGVIAMCSFWVNTKSKQIVEFDIEFNTYYAWGTCGDSGVMDIQNIATHEIGHTLVLNDLYQQANSAQTMYGYSDFGDITKRTLESGDIAGLRALYGK
jgi:hypothetical protein